MTEDFTTPDGGETGGVVSAFGRQLKLLRQRAGLERDAFGKLVGYSPSSIASFEQGRRIPSPRAIDKADEVLDAGGLLKAMKEEVAKAQYPAFFRDMAVLEAKAVGLCEYAVQVVPGLLQTEEYARAVLQLRRPVLDDEVIEQRVVARLARQEIYSRRQPPLLSFLIEEAVLHRPIGGRAVLRGQLEQVLLVAHNRNVDVQVMPTDREDHVGLAGAFTMIDADSGRRLAYAEAQGDSRLYSDHVKVHELGSRYGILRAQALTPRESLAHIEGLLGAV
ncbi:helix-turn-helix domain-containing protein [Streptomyces montanisoli]|uniref:helix-turn-helix domain-containing protein n=1 Tax=Streptomyces montanisoli TaxID=2798581 RepID=UPI0027DC7C4A|nr:helix-turn-helix transcriptional regulator [Streptomyces montanisoli]